MKKIIKIMTSFTILILIIILGVKIANHLISKNYNTKIGLKYAVTDRDQGMALQKEAAKQNNGLLIFGSSELGTIDENTNPVNFFKDKNQNINVSIFGRGYCQSIIQAINISAMGKSLKGKKVVFILSGQWFTGSAISSDEFTMNFSNLQFYNMMFNNDINNSTKIKYASRVNSLLTNNDDRAKTYASLDTKNNFLSKFELTMLKPYYKLKYLLLNSKDKANTIKLERKYKESAKPITQNKEIDWNLELKNAEMIAKTKANNNEFYIDNSYYETYLKSKMSELKNSIKKENITHDSIEYKDFSLLLDACKQNSIKPLFVVVPLHGGWYDYIGFPKSERDIYYKRINQIITENGFEVADFSGKENEPYFLRDTMHLGWKGWVYLDKAMYDYYNEK